jgi:hypothetical protein
MMMSVSFYLRLRLDWNRALVVPMSAEVVDCFNKVIEEGALVFTDWTPEGGAAMYETNEYGKAPELAIEVIAADDYHRQHEAGAQLIARKISVLRDEQRALMLDPQPEVEVA